MTVIAVVIHEKNRLVIPVKAKIIFKIEKVLLMANYCHSRLCFETQIYYTSLLSFLYQNALAETKTFYNKY